MVRNSSCFTPLAVILLLLLCSSCEQNARQYSEERVSDTDTADNSAEDSHAPADVEQDTRDKDAHPSFQLNARSLWSKGVLCPEQFAAHDDLSVQDFGFATISIDGEDQGIIAAVLNGPSGGSLGLTALAVAILDIKSGATISCFPFPQDAAAVGEKLIIDSVNQRYFMSYRTAVGGEASEVREIQNLAGSLSGTLSDGFAMGFHEQRTHETRPDGSVQDVLRGTGEYITWDLEDLVSRDSLSGEELWRVNAVDFGHEPDGFRIGRMYTPAESKLFVAATSPEKSQLFEISSAGVPSKRFEAFKDPRQRFIEGPMFLKDNIVLVQLGSTIVLDSWEGAVLHREQNCISPVTVSESRIACLHRQSSEFGEAATIIVFDLDGSNRQVIPMPTYETEVYRSYYSPWIVAAADNQVLTSVTLHFDSTGTRAITQRFVVTNLDRPDTEPKAFDIEKPQNSFSADSNIIPVVTNDGEVVTAAWGYLFAVATDLGGLAKAPYPRGLWLGGNDNRGYVAWDRMAGSDGAQ